VQMKYVLIAWLFWGWMSAEAQTIYTKDGVRIGEANELVAECTIAADASLKGKAMVLNGIELDTRAYCDCVISELFPTLESTEIIEAHSSGKMMELFTKGDNFFIVANCAGENTDLDSSEINVGSLLRELAASDIHGVSSAAEKYWMKTCLEGVRAGDPNGDAFSDQMAMDYCACALNTLRESDEYSLSDIENSDDVNSDAFQKVVVPCFERMNQLEAKRSSKKNRKKQGSNI